MTHKAEQIRYCGQMSYHCVGSMVLQRRWKTDVPNVYFADSSFNISHSDKNLPTFSFVVLSCAAQVNHYNCNFATAPVVETPVKAAQLDLCAGSYVAARKKAHVFTRAHHRKP